MVRKWRQTSGGRWVRNYPDPPTWPVFRCRDCGLTLVIRHRNRTDPEDLACPAVDCRGRLEWKGARCELRP